MRYMSLLLCAAALSLSGCTGLNVATHVYGFPNTNPAREYTNYLNVVYRGGGVMHYNTVAGQITGASIEKTGKSCSNSVLWLVAWGDSSIEGAKAAAGVTKVGSVDHQILGILGFVYHRHCTVVSGT